MEREMLSSKVYKNLPKDLKELTDKFEGREKDMILLSIIGVISSCLPNIKGEYDRHTVYPNLYILIIAPPASGKGVIKYSRLIIEKIHDKIFSDSKKQNLECEADNKNKKDKKICPPVRAKIVPANISTVELYSFLGNSKHGILIMETEADTMTNMFNNDWSNYSDLMRKTFHHEAISVSRKSEKLFENIKEPKLSILMTGTPNQIQPLLKSKENGLFSRFLIYSFDEISDLKDVFADEHTDTKLQFEKFGDEMFNLYGRLVNLNTPFNFEFNERQKFIFLRQLSKIREVILSHHSESFLPNLHRHGLILYRISMILTVLRIKDFLVEGEILRCTNKDFFTAIRITKTVLKHSLYTFNSIDTGFLSLQDEQVLDELKRTFTRKEAVDVGVLFGIPARTMDDKLLQWIRKKIIKKVSKGNYTKI